MPIYKCEKCNKVFDQKSHYIKHLKRKISCKLNNNENNIIYKNEDTPTEAIWQQKCCQMLPTNTSYKNSATKMLPNVADNDINYKCIICNKIYKDRTGLYRHKKKHPNYDEESKKILIEYENERNKILNDLKNIVNKQQEQIDQLTSNNTNKINNSHTTNNTNNGTIINNNTVNNIIIKFGDEDINKLTQDEMKMIMFDVKEPVLKMVELTHFNNRLPEQQNIKSKNIQSNYVDVYNGDIWIKQPSNTVTDSLFDKSVDNMKQITTLLTDQAKTRINDSVKFAIKIFDNKKVISRDRLFLMESKKQICKDMKLMMYNKTKEYETESLDV